MKHLKQRLLALTLMLALLAGRANAQSAFTNALSFDGTSQHVTVPSGVWFSNQFSVESWVYVRSYASWSRLMDFGNGAGTNVVYCALSSGTTGQPTFGGYNGNGNSFGFVTAPSPLPTNTWVHLAFTCDGTTGRIYTNGILAASGAMTNAASAVRTNNFIGRSNWPADAYANAIFDDFRIWNVARSQAQIQANLGAPLTGNETNLLLYYRFDSASGTVATNSATATGTAYNGTLVNSPTWVTSTAPSTVVKNTNDAGAYSLRSAISTAPAGSTITFDPSLSGATIRLTNGPLLLNKNYNIDASALAAGIIINGNATGTGGVFDSSSGFTNVLTALTITNGVTAAAAGGGGIVSRGNLTLNQSTLTGNSTYASPGIGGAIYVASGTLKVNQCTITGNTANDGSGGGISGSVNLTNSIVAGNTGGNISGSISGTNNLTSGSPLLAPLGNYGGPTPTMPPTTGSPAIDGCTSGTIFTTDQRGLPRIVGAFADIGAVEVQNGAPIVTTLAATGVTSNSATLNATVNPNGAATGYYFEYGTTTNYGSSFVGGTTFTATNFIFSVSNLLTGLLPGTTYHFRAAASNSVGFVIGNDQTFTTAALAPTVTTLAATGVTNTTGTINGSVNPNGAATTAWFEWGATTSYGNQTTPVALGGATNLLTLSSNLTGFTQGITNHYRLVATNSGGTTLGNDIAFGSPIVTLIGAANLTNECHTVFTDPGANNSAGFAVSVSGSVDTNTPGSYPRTYTGTNTLGGVGTTNRTVVVNDTLPPVVTVLGANPLTNLLNAPFVDPGATAKDACAGNLAVVINNTVNTGVAGFYTNTYTANDGNGYSATNTRVVFVRPPATLIVLNTNDSGAGSLRQAVTDADSGSTITFTNTLSGATIVLTNGQITLDKNLTIDASALSNGVSISGDSFVSRVFNVAPSNTVSLTALTIKNGYHEFEGGGIRNAGTLALNRCRIFENRVGTGQSGGGLGAGIYNAQTGTLSLTNSLVATNAAIGLGGGIGSFGALVLHSSTVSSNSGAGIISYGDLVLQGSLVSGNQGGIYFNGENAYLNESIVSGNSADGNGGGILVLGGTAQLSRCTVSSNSASGIGGGLFCGVGNLQLDQCTVSGNLAAIGGGIGSYGVTVLINQSTITGNNGTNSGGGIYHDHSISYAVPPLIVTNSIVAGNTAPANADLADIYSVFSGANNLTNGNPILAPLGNYGGPTPTMPPLTNSLAIDAGSDSATNSFVTDQRGIGFPRLSGAHVDIGAVEYQFSVPVIIATNPPVLTGVTRLGNGTFQFSFTNLAGASFTVFASTNVALPFAQWINLGAPVESPAGT